jgi:hypothetical protein
MGRGDWKGGLSGGGSPARASTGDDEDDKSVAPNETPRRRNARARVLREGMAIAMAWPRRQTRRGQVCQGVGDDQQQHGRDQVGDGHR